ncbi:MAG: recombinase family protein [Oscillospiraceae bacterium]|nr:recombinase family protein [Oscillospiraceae bacterium]
MKTGAVYIRVSTDMQVELSPDSQLKMIEQYAKANDIIISKKYTYVDEGISGRKAEKRPAFMEMIATAKTKPRPFDVILVWKFSRFARNREDSIVYKSMLKKECGIDVVSVSEPIGEDKTSILIEALLEAMDEYYSLNLAEEVRRGMTEKISRGGVVVAPPFGYSIENGVYVPNDNAPIVKMIFEKYLSGSGTRAIAAELNELGIKSTRGNTFGNRNIEYILNNITYIGKLRWNPNGKVTASHKYMATDDTIIVDGKHEPIIDNETFDAVQEKLAATKKKYPARYQQRHETYFFRGYVRCSACGATLVRAQASSSDSLQCHNYSRGQCSVSHSITIRKLKTAVLEAIGRDINNPNAINFDPVSNNDNIGTDAALLREKIKKEEAKLSRVREAYEDGIDTLEEYKANKTKITQTIAALNDKLNDIPTCSPCDRISFIDKLITVYGIVSQPDISPEEFNSNMLEIISRIEFNRKKNTISIFYKY